MAMSEYIRGLRALIGTRLVSVPSASAFVRDHAGRLLLVRHANGGVWACPGGAIDPDEAPQDAAVREVWEETGLMVEPIGLRGVFSGPEFRITYDNGDEVCYVISVFACRLVGGTLQPDGEEITEARFFRADELSDLDLSSWSRVVLPHLLDGDDSWIPPVTWRPPAV
jgi:ADP-ribose pyrophosphatase YjhB (NUDIX family)